MHLLSLSIPISIYSRTDRNADDDSSSSFIQLPILGTIRHFYLNAYRSGPDLFLLLMIRNALVKVCKATLSHTC